MDIEQLDLNAVRVFLAVVEHGGFREAAAQSKEPKSTVSRRVANLEAALGQQLLRRTTRTVSLTEEGELFFKQASLALSSLSDAVRAVREAETTPRGLLKVTAPHTFGELFLGRLVAGFTQTYPQVRLVLDLNDRPVDLVTEGFDVAIRAGQLPDSSLRARLLTSTPFRCFAHRKYLSRRGTPKTPEELKGHDIIGFGTDERHVKWPFLVEGERKVVNVKPRVTVNSFVVLQQLAESGLGIARIPGGLAVEALKKGRLRELLSDFVLPPAPLHAVFPSSHYLSPKVRAFVDFIASSLQTRVWPQHWPVKEATSTL